MNKKGMFALVFALALFTICSAQQESDLSQSELAVNYPELPDREMESTTHSSNEALTCEPQFPGGEKYLNYFLATKVAYPTKAREEGQEGTVKVRITVQENGQLTDPVIIQSVTPELDEAVLQAIAQMPRWKPGRQNGTTTMRKVVIPVGFRLD